MRHLFWLALIGAACVAGPAAAQRAEPVAFEISGRLFPGSIFYSIHQPDGSCVSLIRKPAMLPLLDRSLEKQVHVTGKAVTYDDYFTSPWFDPHIYDRKYQGDEIDWMNLAGCPLIAVDYAVEAPAP